MQSVAYLSQCPYGHQGIVASCASSGGRATRSLLRTPLSLRLPLTPYGPLREIGEGRMWMVGTIDVWRVMEEAGRFRRRLEKHEEANALWAWRCCDDRAGVLALYENALSRAWGKTLTY